MSYFQGMTTPTSSKTSEHTAMDSSVIVRTLFQEPSSSAWKFFALAVLCLLTGTVFITNTGERFTLDE